MRNIPYLIGACSLLQMACGTAEAGRRVRTDCQKNLGDGRILVQDGTVLPDDARFKVVSYKASRTDDGWSYGPCTVELR